ncbi:DUF3971 domain-containing protein [Novosphingobium sp. MW5]|nr:DUF3971 domain-containing protein [Novosphingobium sp. MW5]
MPVSQYHKLLGDSFNAVQDRFRRLFPACSDRPVAYSQAEDWTEILAQDRRIIRTSDSTTKKSRGKRALLLFTAAAVVCAIAALAVLFTTGPVRIPFLGSLLAMQGTRGAVELSVERASVDFTARGGVEIILEDAKAQIDGPSPVSVRLPKLVAPINVDALYAGKIHFSSLAFEKPRVKVQLTSKIARVPDMEPLMEAVDRISDVVDDQFARRGLEFVRISDGEFELAGKTPRRFKGIDADVFRRNNRVIRAFAKVSGKVSNWRMELARSAPQGAEHKSIGVVVNGITLAELLDPEAASKHGKGLGLPASAKIEATLNASGQFLSANAVARVRNGWFQLGKTLVAFDDAALSLLFKGEKAVDITTSHVIRGNTRVFFTGEVEPDVEGTSEWGIRLDSKYPQFGPADVAEAPHMLDGIQLRGRFDPEERMLNIDRFTARSGKAVIHGVGSLQLTSEGPNLALAAEGEQIPVALAKQVWPITLVPPARRWIIERIDAGTIDSVSYTGAIRPPGFDHRNPDPGWSGDDMRVDMTFSDAAVTPIGNIPQIRGLKGTLTVQDEVLTVAATDGTATSSKGGEIALPSGVFKIFDLPLRDGKTAQITTRMKGKAEDLGAVMNSAPFLVLDRADLKNDGVSGSGRVDVEAKFPLGNEIDLADVDWRATGELTDFTDTNPIMGHTVADADVSPEADRNQVAITGKGVLDGLRADIDLVVPLGRSGVAARQDVIVSVTARQLKDKGIDLTTFLNGAMTLSVTKASDGQEFVVDLQQTEVRLQALGWQKAKGVPATASFKLVETEDERRIKDFKLDAEGARVSGSMRLSADGNLTHASFDTFRLRPGDDAEVDIQRAGDGRYDIIFAGSAFRCARPHPQHAQPRRQQGRR